MKSFPADGLAVVVGAGAIGSAVAERARASGCFADVWLLSRPLIDVTDEASIAAQAARVREGGMALRLVLVATGTLHGGGQMPEKSLRDLDPSQMAATFAVNATGPALVMKHFLPLLTRGGKAVFAAISARVGSIDDNRAGGWWSYRASKAALNQFVRTASIELARRAPEAICVALHPGTVASALSAPFAKAGLEVQPAEIAAERLLAVIDDLRREDNGGFRDYRGKPIAW